MLGVKMILKSDLNSPAKEKNNSYCIAAIFG